MRVNKLVLSLLVLCLAVYFAPWTTADDTAGSGTKAKVPDARKTLANASVHLTKATEKKSYNVNCRVQGGVSHTPDHQLSSTSVATQYTADIFRGLMKLTNDLEAYRTQGKGALRNKATNAWQDVLATKEGAQMSRLLGFPDDVLQKALAKADKIEWVWVGDEEVIGGETEAQPQEPEVDAPEGSTSVNPKDNPQTTEEQIKMPHLARITLNKEVALNFWNETKNSGCVSGG